MDLAEIEAEVARIDAILAPIGKAPVDMSDPNWMVNLRTATSGVKQEAGPVLIAMNDCYATGDDQTRDAIRQLWDWYRSFQWGARPPWRADTAEGFRAYLLYWSARDQGADTRDEMLGLRDRLAEARSAGVDIDPILIEVAAISSDVDKYGMGSTRQLLLRCAQAQEV